MSTSVPHRMVYAETLQYAAEAVGGAVTLARILDVPVAALRRWLSGEEIPPLETFLDALDIVADGPFFSSRVARSAGGPRHNGIDRA